MLPSNFAIMDAFPEIFRNFSKHFLRTTLNGVSTNGFFHDSFNIWLESRFFHQYPLKHFALLRSKGYLKKSRFKLASHANE